MGFHTRKWGRCTIYILTYISLSFKFQNKSVFYFVFVGGNTDDELQMLWMNKTTAVLPWGKGAVTAGWSWAERLMCLWPVGLTGLSPECEHCVHTWLTLAEIWALSACNTGYSYTLDLSFFPKVQKVTWKSENLIKNWTW